MQTHSAIHAIICQNNISN